MFSVPASVQVSCGVECAMFEGARVFVLPNPSGRNANFSYAEMLDAYRKLKRVACANPIVCARLKADD